jgi:hypothetical protein
MMIPTSIDSVDIEEYSLFEHEKALFLQNVFAAFQECIPGTMSPGTVTFHTWVCLTEWMFKDEYDTANMHAVFRELLIKEEKAAKITKITRKHNEAAEAEIAALTVQP